MYSSINHLACPSTITAVIAVIVDEHAKSHKHNMREISANSNEFTSKASFTQLHQVKWRYASRNGVWKAGVRWSVNASITYMTTMYSVHMHYVSNPCVKAYSQVLVASNWFYGENQLIDFNWWLWLKCSLKALSLF